MWKITVIHFLHLSMKLKVSIAFFLYAFLCAMHKEENVIYQNLYTLSKSHNYQFRFPYCTSTMSHISPLAQSALP